MTSNNFQFGDKFYKGSVDSGFQEPIDPIGSHETAMEINSFTNMGRRVDLTHTSPLASPEANRRPFRGPPEMYQDQHLQREIASIKQQQQMQQQFLLQQYEQQRQQLEHEHEKQLHEHIKLQKLALEQEHQKQLQLIKGYFEQQQQKKIEQQQRMEKELMEKERLEQIKNKKKTEESAVASTEVKQKLHEFVLTKKQREAAVRDLTGSPPQFRHPWVPNQGSLEQSSPPQSNLSPPYPPGMLGKYDDDFPLRKTVFDRD